MSFDRGKSKKSESHAHTRSLAVWKGITCGCLCSQLLIISGCWLLLESKDTKGMNLADVLSRFCFIVTIGTIISRSYKATARELPYAIRFAYAPPKCVRGSADVTLSGRIQ